MTLSPVQDGRSRLRGESSAPVLRDNRISDRGALHRAHEEPAKPGDRTSITQDDSPRAQRAVTGPRGQSLDPAVLRDLPQWNGVRCPQEAQTEAVGNSHPLIRLSFRVAAMGRIKIRHTSVDLPGFDEDTVLEPVSSLGPDTRLVCDFEFGDATLAALDLAEARVLHGKIRGLRAERATITATRVDSVEFTGCDLSSLRWTGGKISHVLFDACKLLGARFEGVTVEHVVFTGCKLDYAVFDQIRATGPVAFARCSLREAALVGCSLTGSLFDDCDLRPTDFGPGNYRGCDLRDNDLSALTGASNLRRVIIDRVQTMQLGEALAAELEMTFGDDAQESV